MHIPDGYLGPQTYAPLWVATALAWTAAARNLKRTLSARNVPYLAMASAFSFLIMMFNVPIPGGTTGHAVGAELVAILLGPWAAVAAVSVALVIQALVFGDGGITAIGANCFNMAVVMPFVSYWTFNLIRGESLTGTRFRLAGFLAGYIGLAAAAVLTGVEFGIQPMLAHAPDGTPLYAPYPLSIAVPAMAISHLAVFGVLEGVVTMLVIEQFATHEPDMLKRGAR